MKSIKILFIFILFFSAGQVVWAQGGFTPVTGVPVNPSDVGGYYGACVGIKGGTTNCPTSVPSQQQEQTLPPQQQEQCYEAWDGSTVCPNRGPKESGELPDGRIGSRAGCYTGETIAECQFRKANDSSVAPSEQPRQGEEVTPSIPKKTYIPPATKPKTESIPTSGQREFRSVTSGQKIYKPKDILQFDNTLRQRANEIIRKKATEATKKSSTATKSGKITDKPTKTGKSEKQGTQIQPGEFGQKLINDLGTDIQEAIRRKELLKIQKEASQQEIPTVKTATPEEQKKTTYKNKPQTEDQCAYGDDICWQFFGIKPKPPGSTIEWSPDDKRFYQVYRKSESATRQAVQSALEKSLERPLESTPSLKQQFLPKPGEKSESLLRPAQEEPGVTLPSYEEGEKAVAPLSPASKSFLIVEPIKFFNETVIEFIKHPSEIWKTLSGKK